MTERWETMDELVAARKRLIAVIPGYEPAVACGIGLVGDGGRANFPHVNLVAAHGLPAAVLATVCGHVRGTRSYLLTAEQLDRAIDLLTPAEACTTVDHPNLWSWREVRATPTPSAPPYVAVFVADLDAPPVDAYDEALRAKLTSS